MSCARLAGCGILTGTPGDTYQAAVQLHIALHYLYNHQGPYDVDYNMYPENIVNKNVNIVFAFLIKYRIYDFYYDL